MEEEISYTYDQLLDCLSFIGANYEKFVELFTVQTDAIYGIDSSKTYFDCTNFYFEIDRENDFRWKDPILVGYTLPAGAPRFIEDDIVTLWGESVGLITYESVFGASITIPGVVAEYMERS